MFCLTGKISQAEFHKAPWMGLLFLWFSQMTLLERKIQTNSLWNNVDDLTVIENISTRNGSTIQTNLDKFDDRAQFNNMKLNPTKYMYMDVSFMEGPQVLPALRLCDQNLQSAEVVKILGIKIAKDVTWETHIGDILGRVKWPAVYADQTEKIWAECWGFGYYLRWFCAPPSWIRSARLASGP